MTNTNKSVYTIDLGHFWRDPYPDLRVIQDMAPAVFVPELGAVLITRRDDVFEQEKRIDVFSSQQPDGLMTRLMGENMGLGLSRAAVGARDAALGRIEVNRCHPRLVQHML